MSGVGEGVVSCVLRGRSVEFALSKQTRQFALAYAQEFDPEKFQAFLNVACNMYLEFGQPAKIMEPFLKV